MNPSPVTPYSPFYALADVYRNLRDLILHLPAKWSADGSVGTIGALMESGHPSAISTLVALADGTTSLYLSNGHTILGSGKHAGVVAATHAFIDAAEASIPSMPLAMAYPVPLPRCTRFYLMTSNGIWTAEVADMVLAKNASPLSPLFFAGHAVIRAIGENVQPPAVV